MPSGYITYYNSQKKYGFIDCPELSLNDIYFQLTHIDKSYKHIFPTDKVIFNLNTISDVTKIYAHDIKFVNNATLLFLREDYINKKIKKGFLKLIDSNYYVKDAETYFYIKLRVSPYETELFKQYDDKLNSQINYRIIVFSDKNKIIAINIDRIFCSEYTIATSGSICNAIVERKIKNGYNIIVGDIIKGFLPESLVLKYTNELISGQILQVKCINSNESSINPVFELLIKK